MRIKEKGGSRQEQAAGKRESSSTNPAVCLLLLLPVLLYPQSSHFPLNTGLRFSKNARTPSSLSSDEKQRAKRSTSRLNPSSRLEREASLTASFAMRSAMGLFSAIRLAISIVLASRSAAGTTAVTRPML